MKGYHQANQQTRSSTQEASQRAFMEPSTIATLTEVNLAFTRCCLQSGNMRWLALLLAAPAFTHAGYALGPLLPDFLPADTKLVIGIQVRRIIDSPLGKE